MFAENPEPRINHDDMFAVGVLTAAGAILIATYKNRSSLEVGYQFWLCNTSEDGIIEPVALQKGSQPDSYQILQNLLPDQADVF